MPDAAPDADKPEKYIRTFAGDMEILKKGGIPDLTPLAQSSLVPAEHLAATKSAVEQTPPPPPIPTPVPMEVPTTPQIKAPVVTHLQTYAGDFADRMKETHASTATVLAAEQDSVRQTAPATPKKSRLGGILYVVAGSMLLVAGGVGAYIAYSRYEAAHAPVVTTMLVSAPIFVDEREQISGKGIALSQSIEQSVGTPLADGTVRLLYMASSTNPESVFSALQLPVPDILLRNVNVDGSMAGVVNAGGNQYPFFILSVSSYSSTFAGMLAWEATMPRDLGLLFPAYSTQIVSTTTATTTPTNAPKGFSANNPLVATTTPTGSIQDGFRDEVVSNHDVRVYRDGTGRSVLLYGYWDQTTLVIARDAAAFTEILGRLATSHAP